MKRHTIGDRLICLLWQKRTSGPLALLPMLSHLACPKRSLWCNWNPPFKYPLLPHRLAIPTPFSGLSINFDSSPGNSAQPIRSPILDYHTIHHRRNLVQQFNTIFTKATELPWDLHIRVRQSTPIKMTSLKELQSPQQSEMGVNPSYGQELASISRFISEFCWNFACTQSKILCCLQKFSWVCSKIDSWMCHLHTMDVINQRV